MANQDRQERWAIILAAQADSGLTKKDYCAAQGINSATFYYWQRKLQADQERLSTGFQRVMVARDHEVTLRLSNQDVVLRSDSVDTLAQVIKSLVYA